MFEDAVVYLNFHSLQNKAGYSKFRWNVQNMGSNKVIAFSFVRRINHCREDNIERKITTLQPTTHDSGIHSRIFINAKYASKPLVCKKVKMKNIFPINNIFQTLFNPEHSC